MEKEHKIYLTRGDTRKINFYLTDKNNERIGGWQKIYFTVKESPRLLKPLFQKRYDSSKSDNEIIANEDMSYSLFILSSDTDGLKYNKKVFDIEFIKEVNGREFKKTAIKGFIDIKPEITWKENE